MCRRRRGHERTKSFRSRLRCEMNTSDRSWSRRWAIPIKLYRKSSLQLAFVLKRNLLLELRCFIRLNFFLLFLLFGGDWIHLLKFVWVICVAITIFEFYFSLDKGKQNKNIFIYFCVEKFHRCQYENSRNRITPNISSGTFPRNYSVNNIHYSNFHVLIASR